MQWLKRAVGFVEIVAEFAEVGKFLFSIILVVGLISVAAVIAVGFAGVAICLTIICCGVVYLRRYDKQVTLRLSVISDGFGGIFCCFYSLNIHCS